MRILHTADWHIGKQLNSVSLIEDQKYILNQIIQIIMEEKPDALVIAGDIYDRSIPPVEAVELLDKTFNKVLLECKVPIIAIAGNHDNGERLSFASNILKRDRLYIKGSINPGFEKIVLQDEFGPVNFYVIPYMDPPVVREVYGNDQIRTADDAVKAIMSSINEAINLNERNVAVTHGFIIGIDEPKTSESERTLNVGRAEYVSYEHFKYFNYTALGHLHCRQKAGEEKVRYSGSPLKYSFSEINHNKGVEIIDIDGSGNVSIRSRQLIPLRDLQIIEGTLQELLSPDFYKSINTENFIHARISDEGQLIDPIGKLRSVYPNIMSMERLSDISLNRESKTSAGGDFKRKTKLDLFKEFYENVTGREFTKEKSKVLEKVVNQLSDAQRSE